MALWLVLTCGGCTLKPATSDGGGGAGGSDGGGGETSNGGGGGDAGCSEITDCEACQSCAVQGPCADALDLCLSNASCVALDECLTLCVANDADCWEICRSQNAPGVEDYDAARGCIDCDQCLNACASDFACE